jgi:AcrR family transcriptional regulator
MPKLSAILLEKNRVALERAALRCFIRVGYHGVSVRMIAKAAKISLGNLYNYFPDKLSVFKAVIARESDSLLRSDNAFTRYLLQCKFPDDLEVMGAAIAANTDQYRDYFKLVYIDVVEFDGKHIREIFSHLDQKFRAVLSARFERIGKLGPKKDIDPAFAFIAVYMSLYQYFALTKLFGATAVYGHRSDAEVTRALATLFRDGIGTRVKK